MAGPGCDVGRVSACGELFEAAFFDVGVDEGDDDGLIFGAHGLDGFELELELVVRPALVGAEDKRIRVDPQSDCEFSEDIEGRLRGAPLVPLLVPGIGARSGD